MCIGFVGRGSNLGNELPLDDGRFSFQSFVDVGDHESVVERGVDYVIFHRNLKRELRHNDRLERVPVYDHLLAYRRRFGAPVFEDKEIVVFEVAERAPGSGSRPAAAGGAEEGDPP
jgi:hypothetical protein